MMNNSLMFDVKQLIELPYPFVFHLSIFKWNVKADNKKENHYIQSCTKIALHPMIWKNTLDTTFNVQGCKKMFGSDKIIQPAQVSPCFHVAKEKLLHEFWGLIAFLFCL